jgi:geranylgeranyl pyrophosphate synthase
MIHTASLVHDDVIDEATMRRGKLAVNRLFKGRECALAGDYILANATQLLASLGNPRVIEIFAQVIEDLVRGELMQLGALFGFEHDFALEEECQ